MHAARSRDELLLALCRGVYMHLRRVQLYVLSGGQLRGWLQIDQGKVDDRQIRKITLHLNEASIFSTTLSQGEIYVGPVPQTDQSARILYSAGFGLIDEVLTCPVVIGKRVACLLVGTAHKPPLSTGAEHALQRLTAEAGVAFTSLILRQKKEAKAEPQSRLDSGADIPALIDVLEEGGEGCKEASARLVSQGTPAMEAILARFPGRTPPDRPDLTSGIVSLDELGPLFDCLCRFQRPVVSGLTALLHHRNPDTRFFATYTMSMMHFPESVVLLASCLQDEDPDVRLVSAIGLDHMRDFPHFSMVLETLERDMESTRSDTRRNACEGIARLLDRDGIPGLLELLEDGNPEVAETASWALVELTRHNFGLDPGNWRDWWNHNRDQHRVEWLMAALTVDDEVNRQAAYEELFTMTGLSFGYQPDMALEDLVDTQDKFYDWWRRIGVHQIP